MPHHRKIVRDEYVCEAEPVAQRLEQVHDLRLDRDVERGYRLVADDEVRLRRERTRNADALALTAGEFVRETIQHAWIEANDPKQLGGLLAAFGGVLRKPVHQHRLRHSFADCHPRIERGERILEHHLHAAAQRP